jgi:ABC-2 type transport system ATP-binding protein
MSIITTHQLTKHFSVRGRTVEAVRGIDLTVEAGEIFGLLGPNGAGKTTTMRMLTTLLPPSGGTAAVAGHDLLREPGKVRRQIGYVSQAGGAQAICTGRENVVLQARLCGQSAGEACSSAAAVLAALGLTHIADRAVSTYSGGQRRRLDLALGMVNRPRVLFLDEPTTGLDPQSRAQLWDELRRLQADGTSVVLTTHYLDEADALCDRLTIINEGRVVVTGQPDQLKREVLGETVTLGIDLDDERTERVPAIFQGLPFVRACHLDHNQVRLAVERGEYALPQILRLMEEAQIRVRTIALARPSLDDVFLQQTGQTFHI